MGGGGGGQVMKSFQHHLFHFVLHFCSDVKEAEVCERAAWIHLERTNQITIKPFTNEAEALSQFQFNSSVHT